MIVEEKLGDSGAIKSGTVVRAFDELTVEKLAEFQARAETAASGVIATIPEDYTEMTAKVNGLANAIKGHLSGAVVRADDVSPVEHNPDVWVHGKNLFVNKTEKSGSANGLTFVMPANTSNIVFSGTATKENSIAFPNTIVLKKGTYTASIVGAFAPSAGSDRVYLRNVQSGDVIINHITSSVSRTFVLEETTEILANFVFKEGSTYDNTAIGIQIEEGNTATEYTPYVDPSTVTVTAGGKNLLPLTTFTSTPNTTTATVSNGVLTVDGYLVAHRVNATGLIGKTLTISCNSSRSGEKGGGLAIEFRDIDNSRLSGVYKQNELSPRFSFVVPDNTDKIVVFFYASGNASEIGTAEYKNVLLEVGEEATEFEPYNGTEYTPNADGTVDGLTSVSPTMTLLTDTEGVTVECEYNKDTNKVIQKLVNAISAMGGEVTI